MSARMWIAALFFLSACSSQDSPDAQVRAVISQLEQAAEERDVSDFMNFVSDHYHDADGHDAREMTRYLQGYFLVNQSIHILTRIEELSFPHDEEARLVLTAAMAGRDVNANSSLDTALSKRQIKVTLRKEDGDWKVIYAEWDRT